MTAPFAVGTMPVLKKKNASSPWGADLQSFGADNNLLSTQINPGQSAATIAANGQATTAKNSLAGYQFTPFQPVAQPNYGAATDALGAGNNQLQGLSYDYSGANGQYGQAGQTLASARAAGSGALANAGGVSIGQLTGGGAASADTSGLNAGLAKSDSYIGGPFADAADTTDARAMTLAQLKKSMTAPDRAALAAGNLALFESQSQPEFERSQRALSEQAGAMGRRGSALVNQDFADLGTARERTLSDARKSAALEAAGQTLGDNLALTNAGLGVTQGFGGEDRAGAGLRLNQAGQLASNAQAGFQGALANAQLQEAAAGRAAQGASSYAQLQRGIANDQYGMGADAAGLQERFGNVLAGQEGNRVTLGQAKAAGQGDYGRTLADLQDRGYTAASGERNAARGDQYNQQGVLSRNATQFQGFAQDAANRDASNRDELRTERGYQTDRSDKAVQDEITRAQMEEQLRNGVYNRGMGVAGLGFNAPSPTGTYQQAANGYGQQAGATSDALGEAIAQYFANQQRRTGAGTGTLAGTTNNGGLVI